jgi:hypothetical protein
VCCITADPRRKSTIRVPASDAIFPTKSQPFSIIWEDNTDSVVDLRTLLCLVRNFEQGLYQLSASTPTPTSNRARASGTVVSNGAAPAHSSSSSLSPPQAHAPQSPAAAAVSARAAPTACIFDGVHSIPGDLVKKTAAGATQAAHTTCLMRTSVNLEREGDADSRNADFDPSALW